MLFGQLQAIIQSIITLACSMRYIRAQNTRRHAALCRAAAVTCHEALKICGRCAARLAAMPGLSKYFEIGHFYMRDACCATKVRVQIMDFPIV